MDQIVPDEEAIFEKHRNTVAVQTRVVSAQVFCMNVKVGFASVARVTYTANLVASFDDVSLGDSDASTLHVGKEHNNVSSTVTAEEQVVPSNIVPVCLRRSLIR